MRPTTGRARPSAEATFRGRATRNGVGNPVRAADPAISALPGPLGSTFCRMAYRGTRCRPMAGRARNPVPAPLTSACGMPGKSTRAADPGISALPAQSDPIPYQMACWSTEGPIDGRMGTRPDAGALTGARAAGLGDPSGSRIPRCPRFRPDSVWLFSPGTECRPGGHETRYWPPHVYVRGAAILGDRSGSQIPRWARFRPNATWFPTGRLIGARDADRRPGARETPC